MQCGRCWIWWWGHGGVGVLAVEVAGREWPGGPNLSLACLGGWSGRWSWRLRVLVAVAGHDTACDVREASVVECGVSAAAMIMATGAATGAAEVMVWIFPMRAVVLLVPGEDGGWW